MRLEAGALDFLPKKFNEIAKNSEDAGSLLRQRVVQLSRRKAFARRRPLARTRTETKTVATSSAAGKESACKRQTTKPV